MVKNRRYSVKYINQLVKEAIVLGYVEGQWGTNKHNREDFPRDSEIVYWVLRSARANRDLYSLLSNIKY